jgi:hypothetical protein
MIYILLERYFQVLSYGKYLFIILTIINKVLVVQVSDHFLWADSHLAYINNDLL